MKFHIKKRDRSRGEMYARALAELPFGIYASLTWDHSELDRRLYGLVQFSLIRIPYGIRIDTKGIHWSRGYGDGG